MGHNMLNVFVLIKVLLLYSIYYIYYTKDPAFLAKLLKLNITTWGRSKAD